MYVIAVSLKSRWHINILLLLKLQKTRVHVIYGGKPPMLITHILKKYEEKVKTLENFSRKNRKFYYISKSHFFSILIVKIIYVDMYVHIEKHD